MTRRALLSAVASGVVGGTLSACRGRSATPGPSRAATVPVTLHVWIPFGDVPGLNSAFQAASGISLNLAPGAAPVDVYSLVPPDLPYLPSLLPLDNLLHLVNYNPSSVVPDTVDAFRWNGRLYGLPAGVRTLEVAVESTVFASLPKQALQPGWTVNGLLSSIGPGCRATGSLPWLGGIDFRHPIVWGGFLGRDHDLVVDDRLDLSNPTTIAGAQELINLVSALGWAGTKPGKVPPWMSPANSSAFSLAVTGLEGSRGAYRAPWPAVGGGHVCPGIVYGLGIAAQCQHPEAALRFITWLWEPAAQALLTSQRFPPVVAAEGPWRTYFSALGATTGPGWMDLGAFHNVLKGWPGGVVTWPNSSRLVSGATAPYWAAVGNALHKAVSAPNQLRNLLAQAAAETNAAWASVKAAPASTGGGVRLAPGTAIVAAFQAFTETGAVMPSTQRTGCTPS